jgi:glycosyltransferase involved in cell wall biosynthesis
MIVHLVSNRWNSAIAEYAVHCAKALSLLGEKQVFVGLKGSPAVRRVAGSSLKNCAVAEVERFSLTNMPDVMRAIDPATKYIFVYGGAETFLSKWIKMSRPGVKVIRFRGDDRDASKAAFDIRQQWSQGHVDLFLSPSVYLTEKLSADAARRGSDRALNMASMIRTVEHGIDTTRIHREPESDPGPGKRKDLVILGRLDPVKGHAHFFQIFGKMLQLASREEFCLHVVGEPANLSLVHLEDAARSAGLISGKDIIFTTERVADLSRLLSSACAGVISSSGSEIICRVAEEFLVCGTPVAVSGVGSLGVFARPEDGIDLGFNYGLLRSPEVERELLAFCRKSATETSQARSARARHATERFSIETMARQLSKALGDLAKI